MNVIDEEKGKESENTTKEFGGKKVLIMEM